MCVSIKKPYSTPAEYGNTLYSKLSTLFASEPNGYRYIVVKSDTSHEEQSVREPFDYKPVHLQADNTKNTEAGLLTYSVWSAFPIISVAT